jgi:hypothetical protein
LKIFAGAATAAGLKDSGLLIFRLANNIGYGSKKFG